jgi:triacylglycerol lipase
MILATLVFILISNLLLILDMAGIDPEASILIPSYAVLSILTIFFLIVPSFKKFPLKGLRNTQRGTALLIEFLITCVADAGFLTAFLIMGGWDFDSSAVIATVIIDIVVGNMVFWDGIIRVYITSKQIGLKWRLIGIFCGMIPIAHLIALGYIIKLTYREYTDESSRYYLNEKRAGDLICDTKYPLLMVHGVFFRDLRSFNYWGRVPADLEKNGARIYYGNQESAASIDDCGKHIAARIKEIVDETGCGKVNIIAHSKGGLDSRAAITLYGAAPYVASLTTVNTPHRGCQFADYLLGKAPEGLKNAVASKYNAALRKLGDKNPDFIAAVTDLTHDAAKTFNERCPDVDGVYYQSIGSKSVRAASGRFPLNLSYHLVNYFDGPNDGLVALPSMKWGADFTYVTPRKSRGITHGDMIDLMRENIDGFDVRETYVELVSGLKQKGF